MNSEATQYRSLVRPGATATLRTLDGYSILERRPLANDDIDHAFDTGQQMLDAKTGLFDVSIDWDFTQMENDLEFRIRRNGWYRCEHRFGYQEMDYWRLFFDTARGSLNPFLLSTYRNDQNVSGVVGVGADSMILEGPTYFESYWPNPAYKRLAIVTAAGIHYATVTAAAKNGVGNTAISFSPALPATADWANVISISYLLKLRIDGDDVTLEHYALDTVFKFHVRTLAE